MLAPLKTIFGKSLMLMEWKYGILAMIMRFVFFSLSSRSFGGHNQPLLANLLERSRSLQLFLILRSSDKFECHQSRFYTKSV